MDRFIHSFGDAVPAPTASANEIGPLLRNSASWQTFGQHEWFPNGTVTSRSHGDDRTGDLYLLAVGTNARVASTRIGDDNSISGSLSSQGRD